MLISNSAAEWAWPDALVDIEYIVFTALIFKPSNISRIGGISFKLIINLPDEFFKHYGLSKNTAGVYVRGDSMKDMFSDHDVAFLDMTVQRFIYDGVYAFVYDDSCFIMLLQLDGNALKVISLNTKYSPWLIEDENLFKIVGLVKAGICRSK